MSKGAKDADVDRLTVPGTVPTLIADLTCAANGSYTENYIRALCERAAEALQSLSQEAVRDEAQRIYTKADMEAACELALAGYRSKPVLDKLVDRFLAWPLPPSVCSDACVVQRGYPHRIGTNLLTADEARQMLEHVLKREPNAAGQALPEGQREVLGATSGGNQGPAPAAPDVASMVKRLENGEIQVATMYEGEWVRDMDMAREIATLLAKLGQDTSVLMDAVRRYGSTMTNDEILAQIPGVSDD